MNVVAYLLRREAISLMCNYDGMNPQLVDAMVGHATAGSKDRLADLKNEDKWPMIASVYIPEMTENLAYHPVTVDTNWSSKLVTQESAVRVKKGERYQVVYEVGRGTEYVNARLPTTSKAVFESAEASSPNPVPIVLPLIGEGASRCANAATDLASDTGQNKTKVYTYKGARFEVSLNPQKPGAKYLYRGTVKGLDHTSRTIKLEGGYARRAVYVSKPAEGGSMSEEAEKRVCKVIQDLFGLCQHVLSSPKAQLINPCEMSLAELVLLFGKGFVSQNQKQMKKYQNMLSKVNILAFELGNMPVKRIRPKVLQDAMPQNVQPDAKLKHVAALQSFLEYIQVRTHYGQQILPFLDEMRSVFCKGKRETDTKRRIVNAANASYLHNEGEATLNKMLAEHLLEDNRFLAIALIKGAGLDDKDIIALRLKDILPDKQDPRKTFISLRREYANSATQIYTFPMLPYESLLLRQYLAWLKTQGPDRTEPDRYLISNDSEGREPMPKKGFNAFVRCLLMKVVVGYADRLGNPDLSKQKGVAFVKNTYRHRLEEYCGLTQQPDSDALTFLFHQSLAGFGSARTIPVEESAGWPLLSTFSRPSWRILRQPGQIPHKTSTFTPTQG